MWGGAADPNVAEHIRAISNAISTPALPKEDRQ